MLFSIDCPHWLGAWPGILKSLTEFDAYLRAQAELKELKGREYNLSLSDDIEVAALNENFRGMAKPTNVLSFPDETPGQLGDIILAYGVVVREASGAPHKTLAAHIRHLMLHGILHLLGYDHLNDKDAEIMEGLERKLLQRFGDADPYRPYQ